MFISFKHCRKKRLFWNSFHRFYDTAHLWLWQLLVNSRLTCAHLWLRQLFQKFLLLRWMPLHLKKSTQQIKSDLNGNICHLPPTQTGNNNCMSLLIPVYNVVMTTQDVLCMCVNCWVVAVVPFPFLFPYPIPEKVILI